MKPHHNTRAGTKIFHPPQATYGTQGQSRKPRVHIAGESLDWTWLEADRALVYHLWREGVPGMEICEAVGRKDIEVWVLIYEGIENGLIKYRKGAFNGQATINSEATTLDI